MEWYIEEYQNCAENYGMETNRNLMQKLYE